MTSRLLDKKYWLLYILILAAILRFYGITRGDTLTDEVLYGFRAIGPIDFDEAELQTTPLEWFDAKATKGEKSIPAWTNLSFHDHPPLVFWIQHISISIFGENNFALRFPSVVFGLASIFLIYLIGKKLYSFDAAIASALFAAVTVNHVFISRTGLQESFVIFFLLLASYFFLKSFEQEKYFLWTGAAAGLGFLTKYNSFILAPIFGLYIFFKNRRLFFSRKLWAGVIISLVIFSPVIIYNIMLYRAVGHLDFQFSYIFGSAPEVWKVQPGKEVGNLFDRLKNFIPGLLESNSWLFLVITAFSFVAFIFSAIKNWRETFGRHLFLSLSIFWFVLLIFRIGPSYRFLSMLTPYFALSSGVFISLLFFRFPKWQKFLAASLAIFLIFEIFYSYNSQIGYMPKGPQIWAFSSVRFENANWGYNELAKFLTNELDKKTPTVAFESKYNFLEKIQEESLKRDQEKNYESYPALIIYDGNVQSAAQLWVLDRLHVYHAWPVLKTEQYLEFLQLNGFDYFERSGFKNYYFIRAAENVPLKPKVQLTQNAKFFEDALLRGGLEPIIIENKAGLEAFRIYKY